MFEIALMLAALGQTGASPEPSTYSDAYNQSQETGQPMLVVVGAEWCPSCVKMKHGPLSNLLRRGRLKRVHVATVDSDKQRTLAKRLMRGTMVPQVIVFAKTPEGWHREQATGLQSEEQVTAMVDRAVARQAKASDDSDTIQR